MSLANIFLIIVAGMHLGLSVVVLLRNPRDRVNILFSISILFLALWVLATAIFRSENSIDSAYLAYRLKIVFGLMIAWSFQIFTLFFPWHETKRWQKLNQLFLAAIVLASLLVIVFFSTQVIRQIVIQPGDNLAFVNKYFWILYSFSFILNFFVAIARLAIKWRKQEGFLKFQLQSVALSVTVPLSFAVIVNIILLFFDFFVSDWMGALLSVIFSFMCFYFVFICSEPRLNKIISNI